MGFSRFIVAIGSILLLIMVATNHVQAGPVATPNNSNCFVTAYSSMDDFAMTTSIDDSRIIIGEKLTIESNCGGSIEVKSSVFQNRTFNTGLLIMDMPSGFGNITIEGSDWSVQWSNITFMSYSSFYQGIINDYEGKQPQPVDIDEEELAMRELSASLSTLVLAWIGSVMIVDRFARFYVDRFTVEEVI